MELGNALDRLVDEGLHCYGFACVEGLSHPRYAHLPYAVSLVFRLSSAVVEEIAAQNPHRPTFPYFQHYRAANAFLDSCSLGIAALIERTGYRAFPVAASQTVHDLDAPHTGVFPHKTAAVMAGLGVIGKSALFLSNDCGPRVRLATVLTDMPVAEKQRTDNHPVEEHPCFACAACVNACPAGAISGQLYTPGMKREDFFDARACGDYMRRHFMGIGRGSVCGICMAVCPVTQKNTR